MYTNISERILEVRKENSLTQHAMATRIGIHQRKLSRMESNPTRVDHYVIAKIAKEFGISANWLIHGEGPKSEDVPKTYSQKEYQSLYRECEALRREAETLRETVFAQKDLLNHYRTGTIQIAQQNSQELNHETGSNDGSEERNEQHNREVPV